ncbi:MAG: zf-TFIIB domain-containing protein [bacterium]
MFWTIANSVTDINYADYSDVPIDNCPRCQGVWLDKGEFQKIVSYLEELTKETSLSSYLRAFEEEAKQLFIGKKGFFAEAKDLLTVSKLLLYRIIETIPPIAG